jgi:hypothetical protein
MKNAILIVALAAFASSCTLTKPGGTPGTSRRAVVEFGPSASFGDQDTEDSFPDSFPTGGIGIEVAVDDSNLVGEARLRLSGGSQDGVLLPNASGPLSVDLRTVELDFGLRQYFLPEMVIQPYLAGGVSFAGAEGSAGEVEETDFGAGAYVQGGFQWQATNDLAIQGGYRHRFGPSMDFGDAGEFDSDVGAFLIGLAVSF